jgi:NADPH:quinone reductase-like Zn-dependent oxidoreductase
VGPEKVLVTSASGGVGSAAVQLAEHRGALVIGVASASKHTGVLAAGADEVVDRNDNLIKALGFSSIDVVLDLVSGEIWPQLLDVFKARGTLRRIRCHSRPNC